jgi:hypothetical protein
MTRVSYFLCLFFCWSNYLRTILCLLIISFSVVSLHYIEAIENDGLTLCKALDSDAKSCQNSHKDDNDNDNETVKLLGELDTLKQFQLSVPLLSGLEVPTPEYNNSYFFSCLVDLNRPPAFII